MILALARGIDPVVIQQSPATVLDKYLEDAKPDPLAGLLWQACREHYSN